MPSADSADSGPLAGSDEVTQRAPAAAPPPATVEATFGVDGSLGIEFAFPFIESIDPDGAAAAVPGLRPGLMLREIVTPTGRVADVHRLGEAAGMCAHSACCAMTNFPTANLLMRGTWCAGMQGASR